MEWGTVPVSKSSQHYLEVKGSHTRLSPALEYKAVYLGTVLPYESASECIDKVLEVRLSDSTIYRLTDKRGKKALENIEMDKDCKKEQYNETEPEERIYSQIDGAMIQVREEGWKEVKLGRTFKATDIVNSGQSQRITESIYTAKLGNKDSFQENLGKVLPNKVDQNNELVFTTDGAVWIRQMIQEMYPKAVSILDIFHLIEHLAKYIDMNYKKAYKIVKMERYKELLLVKGGQALIKEIQNSRTKSKQGWIEKVNLLKYLEANKERINYPDYIKENYYIGSGAIESAHRHVIQSRMKKAGQIWSRQGAEKMIALRVVFKNEMFNSLFDFQQALIKSIA